MPSLPSWPGSSAKGPMRRWKILCECFTGPAARGLLRWVFWDLSCSVSVVLKAPEGNVQTGWPGSLHEGTRARRADVQCPPEVLTEVDRLTAFRRTIAWFSAFSADDLTERGRESPVCSCELPFLWVFLLPGTPCPLPLTTASSPP